MQPAQFSLVLKVKKRAYKKNPVTVDSQAEDNHEDYISDESLLQLENSIKLQKQNKSSEQEGNASGAISVLNSKGTKESPLLVHDGITPVPHVRHQRITKPGPAKRSPYIDYTIRQALIVTKLECDTYNQIIQYGSTKRSKKNT